MVQNHNNQKNTFHHDTISTCNNKSVVQPKTSNGSTAVGIVIILKNIQKAPFINDSMNRSGEWFMEEELEKIIYGKQQTRHL